MTSASDPFDASTYYECDSRGLRTKVIDARGNHAYFGYDGCGNRVSVTDALGNATYYEHDVVGNVTERKNASGITTYYTYDATNRRTSAVRPDDVGHYFSYDAVGNMDWEQDDRGWTHFTHDAANRLTAEKTPDDVETTHAYDAIGQRTGVSALTSSAYYSYDAAGRMEQAKSGIVALGTVYYEYDAAGRMTQKELGNGCYADFAYADANRPMSISHHQFTGATLAYFGYDYNAGSRIASIRRETGNSIYYTYDDADRLTGETWKDSGDATIYAFTWDYDAVGNRTYQDRDGAKTYYAYDAANELETTHELAGDAWAYFTYDPQGNCTQIKESDGTTYFEYNADDLVTQIKYKDATVNCFWHDAQQRRYAMQDSDGLSYFTWDKNGMNLLAERDSSGAITAEYTHGHTPIDGIGSMVAATQDVSGTTYYQYPIYDHRGTVHNIVDATGTTTDTYKYDAWGKVIQEETSAANNRFRYQSNWIVLKDSDGQLYLSPTRLFHADMGRFLQRDSMDHKNGANLYSA